jgi:hypothetical protein
LIKLVTYSILLFSSNLLLAYQALMSRKSEIGTPFIFWIVIRLLTEVVSYIIYYGYGINPYLNLHISDLLEGIVIIWYFLEFNKKKSKVFWLFLVPPIYFYLEIIYSGAFNNLKGVSYSLYNAMSSILMLSLLIQDDNLPSFSKPIVKTLFIYHSVSFFYSMLEHIIRNNIDLSQIVYPFFLLAYLIFNFYLSYYLWSARKN